MHQRRKNLGTDSESSTDKAAGRDREVETAVEEDGRADLRQIPTIQESPIYNKVSIGNCPVCGKPVCEGKLNFYCSDRDCKFALWKESKYLSGMKKTLTKKMATDLLKKGRTYVKDFYSAKKDKTFAADLVMAIENGRAQYSLEFPKTPAKK